MTEAENRFFEEYKRLDGICRDMFECENGVSRYILEMEENTDGARLVSLWSGDLEKLRYERWLRNRIAHDSADSGLEEKDISNVESFTDRILKGTDPLAMLRKARENGEKQQVKHIRVKAAEQEAPAAETEKTEKNAPGKSKSEKKKAKMYMLAAGMVMVSVSVLLILFLILYFTGVLG